MNNVLNQVIVSPETSFSESEPALKNVMDSIPALVAYIDSNMFLRYANDSFATAFAAEGSVSGKSFPVVVGKQIFNQVQRHMGKVLVGKRAEFKLSISTLSDVQWLYTTLSPDFDHRHRVKGFVFHGYDITEKSRVENEERFKMMADLVPLILWTTDKSGEFNFLSTRWEEVTGQPVSTGLGKEWSRLIHTEDRENINRSWMKAFADRKTFEAKFRLLTAAGTYQVSYAHACPRYTEAGEFAGYIGILQDISVEEKVKSSLEKIVLERTEDLRKRNTALKEAERKLVEKNAALEKINQQLASFAHVASHDLQEPLRKVQTFAAKVLEMDGDKLSDKGKDLMRRVNDSSDRMRSLVRHILESSETTAHHNSNESVDLNSVVNDVMDELEVKVAEKKAKIENLGLPKLKVVRFQFHQLFLNLIGNALKFCKKDSEPRLVLRSEVAHRSEINAGLSLADGYYHHIQVSDNGIGFKPEFSEKIFDKFLRLNGKNQYEGSGLGLAICRKVVEDHNGKITAEAGVNAGATFHIYLPV
jgi:PAS domain S-box-containing protein